MSPFLTAAGRFGKDLLELSTIAGVQVDLKYSSNDNFMQTDLYGGFQKAYLHEVAFKKFQQAHQELKRHFPQLCFLIYDALRPRSVQVRMFQHLAGTSFQQYVAPPEPGSLHNFGMALDLTLATPSGEPLDMGTAFDDFSELSQPRLEEKFLKEGRLTSKQLKNRQVLRSVMVAAGFEQLPHEWWHYNALPAKEVIGRFEIIE